MLRALVGFVLGVAATLFFRAFGAALLAHALSRGD